MNRRPPLYVWALALAGCPDGGSDTSATSSGGQTSSTGDGASETDATTSTTSIGTTTMSPTTGTSGPVPTTSTGDESTTGPVATSTTSTTGDTTGDTTVAPIGPAPDWKLVDVNPNSATYEQERGRSDYAGSVSGWYFAHAT
ncbi:hypothetical protein [Nannocystis sp. SCPEA4]|uniref:hypothetical protein n=1 Tax=Nannocystis sp. SCPEA4 TaxID=2996787 RepID=UPI0022710CC9|nr:hypothetical protein [Nannocystis sp. SCPEA4]MCY1054436.1 hypothetical protein [Nannocystis sp. SCPEA4]